MTTTRPPAPFPPSRRVGALSHTARGLALSTAAAIALITGSAVAHPQLAGAQTADHSDGHLETHSGADSSDGDADSPAAADSDNDHATGSHGSPGSGASSTSRGGGPQDVQLRTTGYSFQDNTPPNSNTISCGTVHKVADGDGTYNNPITVAVPGHGGKGAQIPCGTRIYYKTYKFYGIVEDTGATDFHGQKHTDIWVDGRGYTAKQSEKCMDPVTQNSVPAVLNPPSGLPTRSPGPITRGDTCAVG